MSCEQLRRVRGRPRRAKLVVSPALSSATPTGRLGAAIRAAESARSDALFLDAVAPFLASQAVCPRQGFAQAKLAQALIRRVQHVHATSRMCSVVYRQSCLLLSQNLNICERCIGLMAAYARLGADYLQPPPPAEQLVGAVSTRYIDDTLLNGANLHHDTRGDFNQVVLLPDAFDTRPFRLPWLPGTMLFVLGAMSDHQECERLLKVGDSCNFTHTSVLRRLRQVCGDAARRV